MIHCFPCSKSDCVCVHWDPFEKDDAWDADKHQITNRSLRNQHKLTRASGEECVFRRLALLPRVEDSAFEDSARRRLPGSNCSSSSSGSLANPLTSNADLRIGMTSDELCSRAVDKELRGERDYSCCICNFQKRVDASAIYSRTREHIKLHGFDYFIRPNSVFIFYPYYVYAGVVYI